MLIVVSYIGKVPSYGLSSVLFMLAGVFNTDSCVRMLIDILYAGNYHTVHKATSYSYRSRPVVWIVCLLCAVLVPLW